MERTDGALEGLRAVWAAAEQPQPPLPWYRKVSPKPLAFAVACAAVLGAAVLAIDAADGQEEQRTVALPAEFGGLPRVADDGNLAAMRADFLRDTARLLAVRSAEMTAYGQPGATGLGQAELLVTAVNASIGDAARATTLMLGGYSPSGPGALSDGTPVTDLQTFDPGPLGGAIACALLHDGDRPLAACAWADGSTSGALTDVTAKLTLDQLAERTRELRATAEHRA
ncbi:hypothetical protein GCM10010441_45250 [Kitasatospora paracochleata]|uniref:Anti-sigma factor n=1 Tax=Kitasatospora paracochleata TaxID=58354 RepID=A0ABT1JAM3_9ACTN|nr:hypothetical protein [Kitasatospora paracochleata]MCP2314101.1 hypothetical protein [Kitasatospora paracochleata]